MKVRKFFCAVLFALMLAVPSYGAGDTLIVANIYDAKSLDPIAITDMASAAVMYHVYDNLLAILPDATLEPRLALEWKQLNDTDYAFKLREGVKFHNGEPFTAEDVKFTFERAMGPGGSMVRSLVEDVAAVEVVDDYNVIIKLKKPSASFLMSLGHSYSCILDKKTVESAGQDYGMNPVGTGPFAFVEWKKGDSVRLKRFDDFWGEKPKIPNLIFRSVTEPSTRVIELESGAVDISYVIAQNDMARVEENPKLKLLRGPNTSITYMGMNYEKEPFTDVRVREAIASAIDAKGIYAAVWRGVGQVAAGPMPDSIKYYDKEQKVREQDIEKAKRLLAEAGVKDLKVELWTNERKERVDMATIIQSQLEEIGVTVDIKVLEWGAYLDGLTKKQHDLFMLGWNSSIPDPDYALGGVLLSNMKGTQNFAYFDDPKVDELLQKGRSTSDGPEREKIYIDVQRMVNELVPWVYLHNDEWVLAAQKYVQGFEVNPLGHHSLRKVYFQE